MTFWIMAPEGNNWRLRRRNAGDTADVWSFRLALTGSTMTVLSLRLNLALNEFVVIENVTAGGVGVTYQASIFSSAG
jgi:hypothetical protein